MPITMPPTFEFTPTGDSLWCQMYKQIGPWKKDSKLIIPDTSREELFFCKAIKVGPGRIVSVYEDGEVQRRPMEYKEGDWVIFHQFKGQRIQVGSQIYIILKEDDVLGVGTAPTEDLFEYVKPLTVDDAEYQEMLSQKKE